MKIALDAAAGDHGLPPNIDGAILAAEAFGVEPVLVGPAAEIAAALRGRGIPASDKRFEVVDAPEVIAMDEDPAAACRAKPRSSVMTAAGLVASGRAQAMVSAGHTGATMVAALWQLKRIPGVLRPAIAVPIPTPAKTTVLLDAGANTDCKPWHLLQFAVMGSILARTILKTPRPLVGLLSNGEEENKGNEAVKEALPLLKAAGLNFYGPVEGRDIAAGTVDVVVCDGFVGNIAIKTFEGTYSMLASLIKAGARANLATALGAFLMKSVFSGLKKRACCDEHGGAPLIGVDGVVIIAHGRSNARAISNALRVAKETAASGMNALIRKSIGDLKVGLETAKVEI